MIGLGMGMIGLGMGMIGLGMGRLQGDTGDADESNIRARVVLSSFGCSHTGKRAGSRGPCAVGERSLLSEKERPVQVQEGDGKCRSITCFHTHRTNDFLLLLKKSVLLQPVIARCQSRVWGEQTLGHAAGPVRVCSRLVLVLE